MATTAIVKTNTRSKAFEHIFGADSVDCRFEFIDEATNVVKEIVAHRKVLSTSSPVFAAMFSGDWAESTKAVVIKDASFESFDAFVKHFYQDTIELSVDNVVDLFTLADRYDVQELVAHCESYIVNQLSADNVLKYFPIAVRFNRSILERLCHRLFIAETESILRSDSFLGCDTATLSAFLRMVPKSCDAAQVFDACIGWAEGKCEKNGKEKKNMDNLRAELGECFELIRFKEIRFEALAERYKTYKMLFTAEERDAILEYLLDNTKTQYYLHPIVIWAAVPKYFDPAPSQIRFKLDKRILLDGITLSTTLMNKAPAFSAEIMVRAQQNRVIAKHIADFTVDNLSFTFPVKVFIEAGVAHEIVLTRKLDKCVLIAYEFKRQKIGNVEFIPIKSQSDEIAEKMSWSGTEIRFIDTDK